MPSVRTALIGCGKVGQIHAAALRALPESEFVAVCDRDRARAAAFAERWGVRPYDDVGTMLRDAGARAVMVCTPHPLHAEAVLRAAEAGAHALVEKPLAASLADCDAMLAAGLDIELVLSRAAAIFFKQAFRDGFFHGDQHPGNMFVDAEGNIGDAIHLVDQASKGSSGRVSAGL